MFRSKVSYVLGERFSRGWAVLDQGMWAGSNFMVSIMLARWMGQHEFGVFASGYALFWIISSFHASILTEPMTIYGAFDHRDRIREYLGDLLWLHVAMWAALSCGLLVAGALHQLFHFSLMAQMMYGWSVAAGFILSSGMLRRYLYIVHRPDLAAVGACIYAMVAVFGLWTIDHAGIISLFAACSVLGLAGAISSTFYICLIRPKVRFDLAQMIVVLKQHLIYGRWSVPSGFASTAVAAFPYIYLPIVGSFEQNGSFRALSNLVLPITHITASMGSLILPSMARQGFARRIHVKRQSDHWMMALTFVTVIYGAVLFFVMEPAFQMLYSGKYRSMPSGSWLLVFMPLASLPNLIYGSALRALKSPGSIFRSYGAALIYTFTAGMYLIGSYQVIGSLLFILTSSLITGAWLFLEFKLKLKGAVGVA